MFVVAVAQYIGCSYSIAAFVVLCQCHTFGQVQIELIEGNVLATEVTIDGYWDYAAWLKGNGRYGDALARWY